MKKIWFNHWFSSAYRIIELLRKEYKDNCYIIGTNDKEYCVYQKVCDLFEVEPIFENSNDYINWALTFCKEKEVNIFFPRRNMVAIAERKKDFENIGVTVILSADFETMELFNDKAKAYIDIKEKNICPIPDFEIVNNVEDFISAYTKIKETHPTDRVTFKYSVGEGATSFRVIDDNVNTINVLDTGAGLKMSYNDAVALLKTEKTFNDLMVMPYLKGPEISIDCLNLRNQFIGICRNKIGSRVTEIYQDEELLKLAENIAKEYNLYGPFNIQFRLHNNIPYLLEVNTRMSGGIHSSCLTGVNIPYLAVENALGNSIDIVEYNKEKFKISQVETPIIL